MCDTKITEVLRRQGIQPRVVRQFRGEVSFLELPTMEALGNMAPSLIRLVVRNVAFADAIADSVLGIL